jgi:hypothetical protein
LLEVFLERRSGLDALAWVSIFIGLWVTGISHATSSLLGTIGKDGGRSAECRLRGKGGGTGHKGGKKNNLGLSNGNGNEMRNQDNADAIGHTKIPSSVPRRKAMGGLHCSRHGEEATKTGSTYRSHFEIYQR